MKLLDALRILAFLLISIGISPLNAQEPLLTLAGEYVLKSTWQEYLPDVHVVDDTTMLMVGLNTNMADLTMNIFLRKITIDGKVLMEQEIFNEDNPEGYSYLLSSFYSGSAADDEYVYILTYAGIPPCDTGEIVRTYRLVKARISDCDVEKDTILCFYGRRTFSSISTSALEDSLYLYGADGYLDADPDIILTTMTKDLNSIVHQKIRTIDTHIMPLGITGDSRAVAGSHFRYDYYDRENLQDIWFGRIVGDTIQETYRMDYFASNVLWKSTVLDDREKAFVGYSRTAATYFESSVFVFRNDTLAWNFYDAWDQELVDIVKVGDKYCVIQSSYRNQDNRLDKVILHYIDEEGFAYDSEEFIAPWIQYTMSGFRIADQYFVLVLINDGDEYNAVVNGEIPLEVATYEYTHVFKFRINE